MGCFYAKRSDSDVHITSSNGKTYSWDNKNNINPQDVMFENLKGECVGKLPNSINGQQFIIQNCEDSNIFLFDHINTVTVDDCKNCNIFIGPTKGSIFIRDCVNCKLVAACQQFRTRDCRQIDACLCCATQPTIESTTEIRFGCFQYYYLELEGQFKKASLSIFNNNWSQIHDFTPSDEEANWSILPPDHPLEDFLPIPTANNLSEIKIRTDRASSVVPVTLGKSKLDQQRCLVVFFPDGHAQARALSFIREMDKTPNLLVRTKEVKMDETNTQTVFGTDSYNSVVKRGPVIGLEYNGEDCISACQNIAKTIATETGSTGLVYVSSSAKSAAKQLDMFFNYANVQMSV